MTDVDITMYYWGGNKYGFSIDSPCEECDINMEILKAMQEQEFADKPMSVSIKPWLDNIWQSLRHGGWHPPVVLVNGKVFSQGVAIDRKELASKVEEII